MCEPEQPTTVDAPQTEAPAPAEEVLTTAPAEPEPEPSAVLAEQPMPAPAVEIALALAYADAEAEGGADPRALSMSQQRLLLAAMRWDLRAGAPARAFRLFAACRGHLVPHRGERAQALHQELLRVAETAAAQSQAR